ncbi:hypothetical protein [Achromobacter anxifer]|uniref:hypothetical protein n=1 Tax=Achromobacter anxifer TaxID=1287737 RepID=UPI001583CA0D|nr:hypothetical protein [Achromobacter anxifer]
MGKRLPGFGLMGVACCLGLLALPAWAQPVARSTDAATGGAETRSRDVLTAGPEPRVQAAAGSRDRAFIFGTEGQDELALAKQERAIDEQRLQLQALERLLGRAPDGHAVPSGRMPLNTNSADLPFPAMPKLSPAPAGARLDGTGGAQRQVDDMQRRVDGLLRNADALRQPVR